MASRKIDDLVPELAMRCYSFLDLCNKKGIKVVITCTMRTRAEQEALYAQGRKSVDEVNALRKKIGLWLITEKENKPVTWTLNSVHIPKDGSNKSGAFDFAIVKNGSATWEYKADVNGNDIPDYTEAGEIAESLGLVWGGRWKNQDFPHCQLPV